MTWPLYSRSQISVRGLLMVILSQAAVTVVTPSPVCLYATTPESAEHRREKCQLEIMSLFRSTYHQGPSEWYRCESGPKSSCTYLGAMDPVPGEGPRPIVSVSELGESVSRNANLQRYDRSRTYGVGRGHDPQVFEGCQMVFVSRGFLFVAP